MISNELQTEYEEYNKIYIPHVNNIYIHIEHVFRAGKR